jgi:RNA polymerase sigma factor (sigma-70 family)
MSPYELWLNETDEHGNPLDPKILKAARELEPTFFGYRQKEIGCHSLANTIAQAAVEAASKAIHGRPVENPRAYLFSVFTRKMNRFLDRQSRHIVLDDLSSRHIALDDLSNDNFNKTMKTPDDQPVERQLSLLELLDCMDEETRHISNLRFQGYSMAEIAQQLSISSNTLSARYRRGIARATANLKKRFPKRAA